MKFDCMSFKSVVFLKVEMGLLACSKQSILESCGDFKVSKAVAQTRAVLRVCRAGVDAQWVPVVRDACSDSSLCSVGWSNVNYCVGQAQGPCPAV